LNSLRLSRPRFPADTPKAAIFKARTRLGPKVMAELVAEVAKPLAAPGSSGFHKSWRLVSVDGTCLDIADTPADEKSCGRPRAVSARCQAGPLKRISKHAK